MAGDGLLRTACEAYAREHGVPITFTGFLNQSEIVQAYVAADGLALPSDGGETWGLVVNEAMACSRPCIVSDQVGCGPDLIEEGRTGAIFPMGEVESFAAILQRYSTGRALECMGKRAFQKVQEHSVESAAQSLLRAIDGTLTSTRGRTASESDNRMVFAGTDAINASSERRTIGNR
jgi:glycosyltransferase involved in cell wall biosynthesis